jgi:hypothetical protein
MWHINFNTQKHETVLQYIYVPTLNMVEKERVSEYGQGVQLNTNTHPVPRLGMSGAITPLPHVSLWCAQGQIYL